ncbi:DUF1963 domain-containing protein [Mycetocola tolaasinivorans]|uniref:DUF1963 domain-containing protein n=1 Tax=Mycetocola tolaasinivorans TaxID=76635 RepID=A0A3L7A5F9_9MICO|nr:DUF1963 domain-containing protein [Mycetocola tolaasinivorans]RLP75556.1 DUF1963 domain-containing protein [Mycetocola tolaasinivorans]
MSYMDHPAWVHLLNLEAQYREGLTRIHEIPTREWNAFVDVKNRATDAVRADSALLADIRRAALMSDATPRELALFHGVLTGAVWEYQVLRDAHGDDPTSFERLRADPRLRDVGDELNMRLAVYLPEQHGSEDVYAGELWDDGDPGTAKWRNLTRVGGVPTRVPGSEAPDGLALLAQIDFAALATVAEHTEALAALLRVHPLPPDGLLQVFHSTLGDSRTDPDIPGGGARVRHVAEHDVRARLPIDDRDADGGAFPVFAVDIAVIPMFHAMPSASADALDRGELLQREANRFARNGSYPEHFDAEFDRNPFLADAGDCVRLFGLPYTSFGVNVEDALVLSARLPLAHPNDEHVLLITLPGEPVFEGVFGDGGHLEIWMRQSDLEAAHFDNVVSFIRSG